MGLRSEHSDRRDFTVAEINELIRAGLFTPTAAQLE